MLRYFTMILTLLLLCFSFFFFFFFFLFGGGTDVEEQILVVHIAIGACLLKLKSAQTSLSDEQEK